MGSRAGTLARMALLGSMWRNRPPTLMDPSLVGSGRYKVYARMREQHPVFWDARVGTWVVTGFDAAMKALKDDRLKANRLRSMLTLMDADSREVFEPLIESVSRFLLFMDAPDHTRVRSLVHKAFTPRRVEGMRDHMQEVVDHLLDEVADNGGMDVMQDVAFRLPTTVIAEMLGVPPEDHEDFRRWTEGLAVFLGDMVPTAQKLETGLESIQQMERYFRDAAERVRREPGPDLLTALTVAEEMGDQLSEEELLSTAILLLAAGHETTASLVGNALQLILTHPEQMQMLRDDPALMAGAVEEFLRIESPIQLTAREASEQLELAGQRIDVKDLVTIALGAANHDPAVFDNPETLDVTRPKFAHLAFSHGPHYCIGSMLARAEAQVALNTILKRFPNIAPVEQHADWRDNQVFRGLASLRVTF